jgi:aconitate hydratase
LETSATISEKSITKKQAKQETIAYSILKAHNTIKSMDTLKLRFDSMASHDITFVAIIQTAKASGMKEFPLPYVLTNCHNSLCAIGGTINADDHMFGLSACQKYGGIFVPPHIAVIHQYMREMMAGCGKMILGSDSHTRYGALGTLAVGEGGGELVKQLLGDTYDLPYPEVVGVYLEGRPNPGVGPMDIALAIIAAVYQNGYVKNKIMEFIGPGVSSMTTDYRNGIDVMTTETACLSSVWRTDEDTKQFLTLHGRSPDYKELNPGDIAYYDGLVQVDLSSIKPMIALPFHPSNVYTIETFNENLPDILQKVEKDAEALIENNEVKLRFTEKIIRGRLQVEQGLIGGCSGGNYNNLMEAAQILKGKSCGNGSFSLSIYPSSQAVFMDLLKKNAISDLTTAGAVIRTAFCGPCFGAGDTPANGGFSIRHNTRNFPNREGSKPTEGQFAAVALVDARSISATAANGGILTPATALTDAYEAPSYVFDDTIYRNRVYFGFGKKNSEIPLLYGPNIKDWPEMPALTENILLKICAKILDPVTTTDELIPSGETSSYRSNPLGLAEFTLFRRDPGYVARAKAVQKLEQNRTRKNISMKPNSMLEEVFKKIRNIPGQSSVLTEETEIGSVLYAKKPGDGSAREQAASSQRVLGGLANIAKEYATKRYRSNLINWGMLPFLMDAEPNFDVGDYIYVPGIRKALEENQDPIKAYLIGDSVDELTFHIAALTENEKEIIKAGSLINQNCT